MAKKWESNGMGLQKRKSMIIRYIACIIVAFVASIVLFIHTSKEDKQEKQEVIVYTENSNIGYKVYLKENEFFEDDYLLEDNQYIASLINYIETNMEYQLGSESKNIDYKYAYKIMAEVEVQDKDTKKPLYKFEEELVKEQVYYANTSSDLRLNKKIQIDYNKYNDLIKKFVDVYDLEESNASLTVKMYVKMLDSDNASIQKTDIPVATLNIPLTTNTVAIDIESHEVNGNGINVIKKMNDQGDVFIAVILLAVAFGLALKLRVFIKDTENEEALYNMKLRKIMMNYGSYIQKVNNEYDFEDCQVLEIKLFEDLLQIRETINKPILMTESDEVMQTYFFIPTDNTIYLYELKPGNLKKQKGRRYKGKHPENKDEVETE